ncbi:MAG: tetratricopeptide repeat protein [Candidatus Marinimicrobia bacterium]|nr:tetratricopeptide repeat protein [Candidatus Neomarinimicrobiota bacterium]
MKRILILLSFLAISCQSNSGEMPRQAGQASDELMNGLEAMHHVRFAEARAMFLEGIKKDPNCASCYLNLGNAEQDRVLRRGYFETALEISKKGHPETKLMQSAVDWINGEGGRFDAYPDLYKKYKGDNFLAAGAYRFQASNEFPDYGVGLLEEAASRLNKGHLYNLLAYSYIRNYNAPGNEEDDEMYEKALRYIEKYIELNPNEANAYDSLAEFYLNKGDFDAALKNYQLAFEVDPEFEWATRNIAVAKYQQRMAEEENGLIKWTSEKQDAKNLFNQGVWQFYNLEWEKANNSFTAAIEMDESFAIAYAMRARTHFFMQNQSAGTEDLDIAVSMSLNASDEERNMIMALAKDTEDGTNTFNRVVERLVSKYPDDSFLRFETIFATIDDIGPDAVLRIGKDLYRMNPNFTPALNIMGYAYLQKEEYDNAKESFQEQVRKQAGKANPYDSLGDYYLFVKDNDMALRYFEQSAKMGLKASESKVDSLKSIVSEQ